MVYLYSKLFEGCRWKTKQVTAHHTFDSNIYWSFSVCVSFSLHFCNTLTDDLFVPTLFRLGSSSTSHASSIGRVYQSILRICRVLLHFPHLEGTRQYSNLEYILIA